MQHAQLCHMPLDLNVSRCRPAFEKFIHTKTYMYVWKKSTPRFYSVNASHISSRVQRRVRDRKRCEDKVLTCLNGGKCFVWFLNQKIMLVPGFPVCIFFCVRYFFCVLFIIWNVWVDTLTICAYIYSEEGVRCLFVCFFSACMKNMFIFLGICLWIY